MDFLMQAGAILELAGNAITFANYKEGELYDCHSAQTASTSTSRMSGGAHLDAALEHIKPRGRIVLCGIISPVQCQRAVRTEQSAPGSA